jgi:hypothetical protein
LEVVEMTPQERAAALVEQMLVFIEKTSRRKLSFSAIVDMNTGKTENPQDRLIAAVTKHDQQTRRAALLECANKVKDRAALWRSHGGAKIGFPYGHLTVEDECDSIADELHRLAQEG